MSSIQGLASTFYSQMPDIAETTGQPKIELPLDATVLEVVFDPYDYHMLAKLHNSLSKDFGLVGRRWGFMQLNSVDTKSGTWRVKYWFKHPYDAIVFRLKYPL